MTDPSEQPIDRFIQTLFQTGADCLVFETGAPVRLRMNGSDRILAQREVQVGQLCQLLAPVVPEEMIHPCGDRTSYYQGPSGPVRFEISKQKNNMKTIVRRSSKPGIELIVSEPDTENTASARPSPRQKVERPTRPVAAVKTQGTSIDSILQQLIQEKGSDLHLTTGQPPKIRVDGSIVDLHGWPPLTGDQIDAWVRAAAPRDLRDQFDALRDADFGYEIAGLARFRLNWFVDRNGVGAVIRAIASEILTLEQLSLPPVLAEYCQLNKGLILVTGPTGSGKSTTLAAMIDRINRTRSEHIVTVEDPIEFVHTSKKCLVNQREVNTHTQSFSAALRAVLREDPDVVLVGELRDPETVAMAIETAETGHLVFGTLHTNTAAGTVDRIIDQFPTDQQSQIRVMLSESLKGVVSQTLCKKVGGGRAACLEILTVNSAVSNLIREGKTFQIPSLMQTGKGIGMQTSVDAMTRLVQKGLVTPEEAFAKASDQPAVKAALERAGIRVRRTMDLSAD